LAGEIDGAARLASQQGWRSKAQRRSDAPVPAEASSWSILSFRRDQGLLSQLFVIEYHPGAATTPDYAQPLYDRSAPPRNGPNVWLRIQDAASAERVVATLGGQAVGHVESGFPPYAGTRFRFPGADLIIAGDPTPETQGVCRVDISGTAPPAGYPLGETFLAVIGEIGG